jgi:hypothetical protein
MKRKGVVFAFVWLSAVVGPGCGTAQEKAPQNLPPPVAVTPAPTETRNAGNREIIVNGEAEDFKDIVLWIDARSYPGAAIRYKVTGTYRKKEIGFLVDVPKAGSASMDAIVFRSLGATSDEFLISLAAIYGLKSKPRPFAKEVKATFLDMGEFARKMGGDRSDPDLKQLKVFFGKGEDVELFLNINETAGTVELGEKDEEYREGVVKELSRNN